MTEIPFSMTEIPFYILVGVASGVLTAFLVSTLGDLWAHTVLPFLARWRYRGPDLAGEWKGLGTGAAPASGEWSEVALTLNQDTRDLRGTMVLRDRSAGHSIDLNLQATGTTENGYITLSLWPAKKAARSVATALLKIDAGSGALDGQLLFLGARDAMEVINVSVHRAGSIAAPRLVPSANAQGVARERYSALLKG